MQGKLELMMGPMRSNKTAELLRRADMRRQYAKQHVMVLKPSDDTKGGPGVVLSKATVAELAQHFTADSAPDITPCPPDHRSTD
jgi:thymidine kinase